MTSLLALGQNKPFEGIVNCSARMVPNMTVEQCERDCGIGWRPYEKWEVLGAITTWSIPLFVLVGNMHFSNFQMKFFRLSAPEEIRRYWQRAADTSWSVFLNYSFVVVHLLGNPIDLIWSHLEKLDHMRQTRTMVKRKLKFLAQRQNGSLRDTRKRIVPLETLIVICIALDDFNFDNAYSKSSESSTSLIEYIRGLEVNGRRDFLKKCHYSAKLLADTRTSSARRAALAVIAYIVALYTSVAAAMAQHNLPVYIPHTLALRELYYWLIPAIALSSATGAFPTGCTAKQIMDHIVPDAMREKLLPSGAFEQATEVGAPDPIPKVFSLEPLNTWEGGNYGYRPQKRISLRSLRSLRSALLLSISFLAVGGAWAFSFTISWFTPTRGLGCRSFMELGFFVAWVLNFISSYCIGRKLNAYPRGAFVATFIIDTLIAVPSVLCLFIAFRGWFNSCKCWAAIWTLRKVTHHYIPIGLSAQEHAMAPTYYGLIGGGVGLQTLLSVAILAYYGRVLRLIHGSWVKGVSTQDRQPESNGDVAHGEQGLELNTLPNGQARAVVTQGSQPVAGSPSMNLVHGHTNSQDCQEIEAAGPLAEGASESEEPKRMGEGKS